MPEHDGVLYEYARCSVCGERFALSALMHSHGFAVCPACLKPQSKNGGSAPMLQVEIGEHQRLLHLYYAAFEDDVTSSEKSRNAVKVALDRCNRFFEGGSGCRL